MKGGIFMPYIIKEKTYALLPCEEGAKVIESSGTKIIEETPLDIIAENCYMTGSSLAGRQKGSAYIIGTTYKPPIVIDGKNPIILIPTHSVRQKCCIWVNFHAILTYYIKSEKVTIIEFKNHKKIEINLSYSMFDKQILRATRLDFALRAHLNEKFL
jgi:competence transcription factor ComK